MCIWSDYEEGHLLSYTAKFGIGDKASDLVISAAFESWLRKKDYRVSQYRYLAQTNDDLWSAACIVWGYPARLGS